MAYGTSLRASEYVAGATALAGAPILDSGVLALTLAAQGGGATVQWGGLSASIRVVDAWFVRTVGASPGAHTTTIRRAAGQLITNAVNTNVADTALIRAAQINDANDDIAAGGNIEATVSAASADMIVYIAYVRV